MLGLPPLSPQPPQPPSADLMAVTGEGGAEAVEDEQARKAQRVEAMIRVGRGGGGGPGWERGGWIWVEKWGVRDSWGSETVLPRGGLGRYLVRCWAGAGMGHA